MGGEVKIESAHDYWTRLGYAGPPTPRTNPEPAESDESLRARWRDMTQDLYIGESFVGTDRPTFRNLDVPAEPMTIEVMRATIREYLDKYAPLWMSEDDVTVKVTGNRIEAILSAPLKYTHIGIVGYIDSDGSAMALAGDDTGPELLERIRRECAATTKASDWQFDPAAWETDQNHGHTFDSTRDEFGE